MPTRPSSIMLLVLRTIKRGRNAQIEYANSGAGPECLLALAEAHSWARTIKHRDSSTSLVLTRAGRAAISAPDVERRLQDARFEKAVLIAQRDNNR